MYHKSCWRRFTSLHPGEVLNLEIKGNHIFATQVVRVEEILWRTHTGETPAGGEILVQHANGEPRVLTCASAGSYTFHDPHSKADMIFRLTFMTRPTPGA